MAWAREPSRVGAAWRSYFRKPVSELEVSEAALVAGLIPAPSRYEPRGSPTAAESRRVLVFDKMLQQGYRLYAMERGAR